MTCSTSYTSQRRPFLTGFKGVLVFNGLRVSRLLLVDVIGDETDGEDGGCKSSGIVSELINAFAIFFSSEGSCESIVQESDYI